MESFIGVFDSGMGGVTVLADLVEAMPCENYIFYGDSINAPYGIKSQNDIIALTDKAVEDLIDRGAKVVVVACNTATSAAINYLRDKYPIPIIGMEPAIKPALKDNVGGHIAVMATPMTLKLDKFNSLIDRLKGKGKVLKISSPKLVTLVEKGVISGNEIESYIMEIFSDYDAEKMESIVLGCTHFLYLKRVLMNIFGEGIKIYDGNIGTVNRVKQILMEKSLVTDNQTKGSIRIENSLSDDMVKQSFELFNKYQELKR